MTNEEIMKMYIYEMQCCVAARNNEIIQFSTTWLELEDIILSNPEKDKQDYITYLW